MIKILEQGVSIYNATPTEVLYESLAAAGHVCYRRAQSATDNKTFLKSLISNGHLSVLEHEIIRLYIRTSRGVLAELTRHRHANFSVESTRYVKYVDSMEVIGQNGIEDPALLEVWKNGNEQAWAHYKRLIDGGARAEIARDLLPLCLVTRLRMTANVRAWREILKTRLAPAAHPQMRELMGKAKALFVHHYPVLFEDI